MAGPKVRNPDQGGHKVWLPEIAQGRIGLPYGTRPCGSVDDSLSHKTPNRSSRSIFSRWKVAAVTAAILSITNINPQMSNLAYGKPPPRNSPGVIMAPPSPRQLSQQEAELKAKAKEAAKLIDGKKQGITYVKVQVLPHFEGFENWRIGELRNQTFLPTALLAHSSLVGLGKVL